MKNKIIDQKVILITVTLVILMAGMFYFISKQKSKKSEEGMSVDLLESTIKQLESKAKKSDKLLEKNEKLLSFDKNMFEKLDPYIELPQTEKQIEDFIDRVGNKYPFGDPIREKNLEKK